jgi:serine/threonine protein kinase
LRKYKLYQHDLDTDDHLHHVDLQKYELCQYEKLEKIGEGTFGQVYKGEHHDPKTGARKLVALKKLNMINEKDGVSAANNCVIKVQFPITALREIRYLKVLSHPNVVKLETILASKRT